MPWDRSLYPDDWDAIALSVKEEQDYVCAGCGVQCYRPGDECETMTLVMSVSHYPDPTPSNVSRDNLTGLCSRCHLRLDQPRIHRKIRYGAAALDPAHQPGLFEGYAPFYPNR